jgi:hypothetical protein
MRWHYVLDPSIDRANERTDYEDKKSRDAVLAHGGKDWLAIVALIPGRTRLQCKERWCHLSDPNTDLANRRMD